MRKTLAPSKIVFSVLLLIAVILTAFQNCARVTLERPIEQSVVLEEKDIMGKIEGRYCTQLGVQAAGVLKVVIVLDLSLSNVGAYSGSSFQTSLGTDPNSLRFQALKQFVSTCAAGAQYTVVGFATNRISSTGGSCSGAFGNAASANSEIDYLYNTERTNRTSVMANPTTPRPDLLTSYEQGLTCAQDIIQTDLERGAVQPDTYYQVFFVTDGSPTVDSTCETSSTGALINCDHEAKNSSRVRRIVDSATALGASAKVQPVFYGNLASPAVESLMSKMAIAGRVSDYVLASKVDEVNFCGLLTTPTQVKYAKQAFVASPLTMKPIAEGWTADTDMDGIADSDEAALGFTPGVRRTGGILDGVCQGIGSPAVCQNLVTAKSCTSHVNNFGLTECDLAGLGFLSFSGVDAGIDSDSDGLPDMIEVLHGSEPGSSDAIFDSDGDGVSNVSEIRRGSLLNTPDASRDSESLIKVTESLTTDASACPEGQEVWKFTIENIPIPPIPAFNDSGIIHPTVQASPRKELLLSHSQNEHLIFVGFSAAPVGRADTPDMTMGTIVKIKRDGYTGQAIVVQPSDFVLIGESQND